MNNNDTHLARGSDLDNELTNNTVTKDEIESESKNDISQQSLIQAGSLQIQPNTSVGKDISEYTNEELLKQNMEYKNQIADLEKDNYRLRNELFNSTFQNDKMDGLASFDNSLAAVKKTNNIFKLCAKHNNVDNVIADFDRTIEQYKDTLKTSERRADLLAEDLNKKLRNDSWSDSEATLPSSPEELLNSITEMMDDEGNLPDYEDFMKEMKKKNKEKKMNNNDNTNRKSNNNNNNDSSSRRSGSESPISLPLPPSLSKSNQSGRNSFVSEGSMLEESPLFKKNLSKSEDLNRVDISMNELVSKPQQNSNLVDSLYDRVKRFHNELNNRNDKLYNEIKSLVDPLEEESRQFRKQVERMQQNQEEIIYGLKQKVREKEDDIYDSLHSYYEVLRDYMRVSYAILHYKGELATGEYDNSDTNEMCKIIDDIDRTINESNYEDIEEGLLSVDEMKELQSVIEQRRKGSKFNSEALQLIISDLDSKIQDNKEEKGKDIKLSDENELMLKLANSIDKDKYDEIVKLLKAFDDDDMKSKSLQSEIDEYNNNKLILNDEMERLLEYVNMSLENIEFKDILDNNPDLFKALESQNASEVESILKKIEDEKLKELKENEDELKKLEDELNKLNEEKSKLEEDKIELDKNPLKLLSNLKENKDVNEKDFNTIMNIFYEIKGRLQNIENINSKIVERQNRLKDIENCVKQLKEYLNVPIDDEVNKFSSFIYNIPNINKALSSGFPNEICKTLNSYLNTKQKELTSLTLLLNEVKAKNDKLLQKIAELLPKVRIEENSIDLILDSLKPFVDYENIENYREILKDLIKNNKEDNDIIDDVIKYLNNIVDNTMKKITIESLANRVSNNYDFVNMPLIEKENNVIENNCELILDESNNCLLSYDNVSLCYNDENSVVVDELKDLLAPDLQKEITELLQRCMKVEKERDRLKTYLDKEDEELKDIQEQLAKLCKENSNPVVGIYNRVTNNLNDLSDIKNESFNLDDDEDDDILSAVNNLITVTTNKPVIRLTNIKYPISEIIMKNISEVENMNYEEFKPIDLLYKIDEERENERIEVIENELKQLELVSFINENKENENEVVYSRIDLVYAINNETFNDQIDVISDDNNIINTFKESHSVDILPDFNISRGISNEQLDIIQKDEKTNNGPMTLMVNDSVSLNTNQSNNTIINDNPIAITENPPNLITSSSITQQVIPPVELNYYTYPMIDFYTYDLENQIQDWLQKIIKYEREIKSLTQKNTQQSDLLKDIQNEFDKLSKESNMPRLDIYDRLKNINDMNDDDDSSSDSEDEDILSTVDAFIKASSNRKVVILSTKHYKMCQFIIPPSHFQRSFLSTTEFLRKHKKQNLSFAQTHTPIVLSPKVDLHYQSNDIINQEEDEIDVEKDTNNGSNSLSLEPCVNESTYDYEPPITVSISQLQEMQEQLAMFKETGITLIRDNNQLKKRIAIQEDLLEQHKKLLEKLKKEKGESYPLLEYTKRIQKDLDDKQNKSDNKSNGKDDDDSDDDDDEMLNKLLDLAEQQKAKSIKRIPVLTRSKPEVVNLIYSSDKLFEDTSYYIPTQHPVQHEPIQLPTLPKELINREDAKDYIRYFNHLSNTFATELSLREEEYQNKIRFLEGTISSVMTDNVLLKEELEEAYRKPISLSHSIAVSNSLIEPPPPDGSIEDSIVESVDSVLNSKAELEKFISNIDMKSDDPSHPEELKQKIKEAEMKLQEMGYTYIKSTNEVIDEVMQHRDIAIDNKHLREENARLQSEKDNLMKEFDIISDQAMRQSEQIVKLREVVMRIVHPELDDDDDDDDIEEGKDDKHEDDEDPPDSAPPPSSSSACEENPPPPITA